VSTNLDASITTVEPVVGTVCTKLGLPADAASNRRAGLSAHLTYYLERALKSSEELRSMPQSVT
jgi:hypothetical protein